MNILIDTVSPVNNYISYNKFSFIDIPAISIQQYFLNCTENLYFLVLAILQLMTYSEINLLPAHWFIWSIFNIYPSFFMLHN